MICLVQAAFVHEPTASYTKLRMADFAVYVSHAEEQNQAELKPALDLLRKKLIEVKLLVPKPAFQELTNVKFFIEAHDPGFPCACYHEDAEWLKQNGYNLDKVHSVEIANAKNFVSWIEQTQPLMVLHELAHAFHKAKFGFDDPYIKACYERIRLSGLYDMVERNSGKHERHYALTNQMEYFAETTEAYFGENDFSPFNRGQLKQADPQGYDMIERCWGIKSDRKAGG